MIDSLLYLTTNRSNMMFSAYICARFQSYPIESHLLAIKKIFCYLRGTIDFGLWYYRSTHIDLTCNSGANFVSYKVNIKSTNGIYHFLGHSVK